MNNESCVSAPVYVMLSGGHLMQVVANEIGAKVNIPFSAAFDFDTLQQLTAVAKEQKGYLNAAAEAAFYSALNVHDRGLQSYRYSVGLHKAFGGGGLTLSEGSSSAGLGYALTLALANRQQCQKTGLRAYQAIYATGALGVKRGLVQKIGYLADKIQTAVAHAQSNAIESFVIFYPADNEADVQSLSAAFLAQLQASGGRLVAVQWIRDALVHLYDEFDGPAVADWTDNPFLGLQSFEISDNWRYFGAKQKLRDLYRQYLKAEAQHELLVVTGLSGSGKSSLVKAGLLPNLRDKKGAAIHSILANEFASFNALQEAVAQWAAAIEPADSTRSHVLLIDQFESCVTLLGASTEEWLVWTQQLNTMCQEQPAIRLIVTVRSDFLTLISSAVNSVALVDKRPDELELAEIIEQSAWAVEIELSEALIAQLLADAKTVNYVLPMLSLCLSKLYEHGLKQWGDEAASDPQAWGRRKPTLHVSDYVAIGGLSGVLRQALDEIFTEYGQELTALFFELFVGSRDGLLYARSVPQIELGQHEFLANLVDTLYQQKLLLRAQSDMVSADAESVKLSASASHAYRLAHDCLLNSWPLLQAWVEKQQERAFFEWQNKVAMRYQTWIAEVKINATDRNAEESGAGSAEWLLDGSELSQGVALQGSGNIISPWMRDYLSASQEARATRLSHETRKARRRSLVFAVLAVAALAGGAGAYWQKLVADGERVRAEAQQKKAENLLGQTQQSLEFMNWELRPVLEQYVKTEVKEQLISRMEDMLKTLKPYQSAEQSYLNQISLLNSKAKVLLQNKNNKAALQQALALQLEAKGIAEHYRMQLNDDRNMSVILDDLGDTSLLLGQTEQALAYYEQSKSIREQLAKTDPYDTKVQRDIYVSSNHLGDLAVRMGELRHAQVYYQRGKEIASQLSKADPKNTQYIQDLSLILNDLGNVAELMGHLLQAQTYYQQGKELAVELLNVDPNNVQFQRELLNSLDNLGDVAVKMNQTQQALNYYQQRKKIASDLANADTKNTRAQRDLSRALRKMGDISLLLSQTKEAMVYYQQEYIIAEQLTKVDSSNTEALHDLSRSLFDLGEASLQLNQTPQAINYYQQGKEILEKLLNVDSNNADMLHDLSACLNELGDLAQQKNQIQQARDAYQEGSVLADRLVKLDSTNVRSQRSLLVFLIKLGELELQSNKLQSALIYHEQAEKISEKLAKLDPNNSQAQRDLSISLHQLGDIALKQDQPMKALGYYERGKDVLEKLSNKDPTNSIARFDLSISLNRLGDVSLILNQLQKALGYYQQGKVVSEQLTKDDSNNAQGWRALSLSLSSLGYIVQEMGQLPLALSYYQQSKYIDEKLAKADPNNLQAQRDLSISLNRLGGVAELMGQLPQALAYYEQNKFIDEQLAKADPSNAKTQRDLSLLLNKLGSVAQKMRVWSQAHTYYEQSKVIAEKIAKADSSNAQAQRDLSIPLNQLGNIAQEMREWAQARDYYEQSKDILEKLAKTGPSNINLQVQSDLSVLLTNLGRVMQSMGLLSQARAYYQMAVEHMEVVQEQARKSGNNTLENEYFGYIKVLHNQTKKISVQKK